jgi:hypothetical protein
MAAQTTTLPSRIVRVKMQKHKINYPEREKCVDILVKSKQLILEDYCVLQCDIRHFDGQLQTL